MMKFWFGLHAQTESLAFALQEEVLVGVWLDLEKMVDEYSGRVVAVQEDALAASVLAPASQWVLGRVVVVGASVVGGREGIIFVRMGS